MKILVMGSGAVGGYLGALLFRNGEDVTFVARGQHLDAIRKSGLRIESVAKGDFTIHPPATDRPDGSWKADLVLFCVKSYHNPEATEVIRPAVGDATSVLTLQNGLGSGDQLGEALGHEKVLLGAAYLEVMRKEPGVIAEVAGQHRAVFGEPKGGRTPRAEKVLEALQAAGTGAELSDDVLPALWSKLVFICGLSGMTCVTRSSFADVIDTPETFALIRLVVQEAAAVGGASGVKLDEGLVEATIAEYQDAKNELVSSMYLDLQRGNRLEIGSLNGAVARIGQEVGVETPVNEFITACLTIADNLAKSGPV